MSMNLFLQALPPEDLAAMRWGRRIAYPLTCALALLLAGCTSVELSRIGEAWARNECLRNPDEVSRSRCVDSNSKAFDESRRQSKAVREQSP